MTRFLVFIFFAVTLPVLSRAESRAIALDVSRGTDKSVTVSIYSDVKSEQKNGVSVPDAATILKNAKGWGSNVEIAIVTDGVQLRDYFQLVQAINENIYLNLAIIKARRDLGEHILKHYNIEPNAAGNRL